MWLLAPDVATTPILMKTRIIIVTVLISTHAFAGLGDKGLHVPSAHNAAHPNSTHYLHALGEIESGGDDFAIGRHGEVGRFQCLPAVWRKATGRPLADAVNPAIALVVTLGIIRARTGRDPSDLTPEQFCRAWHCPSAKRLNREQRDYVNRFLNLEKRLGRG
jgi:hypothetical protein